MRTRLSLVATLLLVALGVGGWLLYQDGLIPVPLADGRERFIQARPEFGEDAARLEVLMPAGPGLEALLSAQSDLPLIERGPEGRWLGQLASGLQTSRHGRRWRVQVRSGWRMQDGGTLDAERVGTALRPGAQALGGEVRVIDASTLDLRFTRRQEGLPEHLARWQVPGTGAFVRKGHELVRFDRFMHGRAGIAGLTVVTEPGLLESRAWAEGLASARWAWTVFPGKVAPEDMARVRSAPYDEFRMKDGSVWFMSRRLRRLRPDAADWTRTRLFGVWKGSMDLPYDPLGM